MKLHLNPLQTKTATDSQSIFNEVKNFGGNVEMTNPITQMELKDL